MEALAVKVKHSLITFTDVQDHRNNGDLQYHVFGADSGIFFNLLLSEFVFVNVAQ